MRYTTATIIMNPDGSRLLAHAPQKDGTETIYECGIAFIGSWASRLEQHKAFCITPIGEYILNFEKR